MNKRKLLSLAVLCSLLTSCVTNFNLDEVKEDSDLNTSLGFPIGAVHADMVNLLDLVNSEYVAVDSSNAVCIVYDEYLKLMPQVDTMTFDGKKLTQTINLNKEASFEAIFDGMQSNKATLLPGNYAFGVQTKYNLDFNRNNPDEIVQVDSGKIERASIDFRVKTEGIELSDDNFLILSFEYTNLFEEEFEHKYENIVIKTNDYIIKDTLSGYFTAHFDPTENGNFLDLDVKFNLVSSGNTTISKDAKIKFETKMHSILGKEAYGFVWFKNVESGSITYDIPQDIFEKELLKNNNLLFTNPQVEVIATTNAGVPIQFEIDNVYATKGDRVEYASFNGQKNAIVDLQIPSQPYDSAQTIITVDKDFGSLNTLFSMLPETINLDYSIKTPQAERNENLQFVTKPLIANLKCKAKLPLQFDPTSTFAYADTLDIDFSNISKDIFNTIEIDTIDLYLDITSALPANTSLKLIYLDENDQQIMESETFTIASAMVDAEGTVTTPTVETLTLTTTGEAIEDVLNTKKIKFEISLNGYDENSRVYFHITDAIDIKVNTFIKTTVQTILTEANNQ